MKTKLLLAGFLAVCFSSGLVMTASATPADRQAARQAGADVNKDGVVDEADKAAGQEKAAVVKADAQVKAADAKAAQEGTTTTTTTTENTGDTTTVTETQE